MSHGPSVESRQAPPIGKLPVREADGSTQEPSAATSDLHLIFDQGRSLEDRKVPRSIRDLALSLRTAVSEGTGSPSADVDPRIITDTELRREFDRDQNVYLGTLFTRFLTHAVPDMVFQPVSPGEVSAMLAWAVDRGVPVTTRGAGTTAMGGSVPNQGGVVLDLSRLDAIEMGEESQTVEIGAGVRFRTLHKFLAQRNLALPVYTSNLGGTFAGWFATGGIGLNAFGSGCALDAVEWIEVVLPTGELVRVYQDRHVAVPMEDGEWQRYPVGEAADWFEELGIPEIELADWAGTEGQLGVITRMGLVTTPRKPLAGFLIGFKKEEDSFEFLEWLHRWTPSAFPPPANLKWLSGEHLTHAARAWSDDDARAWSRRPGELAGESEMPWSELIDPRDCDLPNFARAEQGIDDGGRKNRFRSYVFIDFNNAEAGRSFTRVLDRAPGEPRILSEESLRLSAERFRPQSAKRFGPGLLAAEILLPAAQVPKFLSEARRRARGAGVRIDAEVYYLQNQQALVIAGYLADHRNAAFGFKLVLAPSLTDLALRRYSGKAYVLGRWQGAFFRRTVVPARAERLRAMKRALDPAWNLNRGSFFRMGMLGLPGSVAALGFLPLVRTLGALMGSTLALPLVWTIQTFFSLFPGPGWGRGKSAQQAPAETDGTFLPDVATQRAIGCVNCGECNSVCPVFWHSGIRLPQMLTHLGESVARGKDTGETGASLLDLCMRCGNCEEVCQAGIPHLSLYESMQAASDRRRAPDRDRHLAILETIRTSANYRDRFLGLRKGGYKKRTPAALPGLVRYVVQRAETQDGAAATCIHCAACVPVCPTHANLDFRETDARLITTDQTRCIGCGTCVEVCPANLINGGQTLRVFEAPTEEWLATASEILATLDSSRTAKQGPTRTAKQGSSGETAS